jgi:exodeoxyribonuclease VII large subunit
MEALTITQFCNFVKNVLPNKKFNVIGEVNQLKNSHGHLFFTFKDNENCLSATIWKTRAEQLKVNLKEGDKITVEGKIDFYSPTGKINFIIDKIVSNEGLGDLQKKYDQIKDDFQKKGYFDDLIKRKIIGPIKNILVITSESGAAYQDFIYALENSGSNVNINLLDVVVQGIDCPKNICIEMEKIKNKKKIYDLVILTRGGGSFQDLFGFSQPELIETIHNFHLPVISAIGHQVDNPLSDLVSDYSVPTPSLAAQFIVDFNRNYLNEKLKIPKELNNRLNNLLINEIQKLNNFYEILNRKWFDFENKLKEELSNSIHDNLRKLDLLELKLDNYQNEDIILNGNGKIISNANELLNYKDKTMEIIWNNVIVKVKIESMKTFI